MKFLSLALSVFLIEAASAARSLSSDELNSMLRSGKIDKNTLLKQAIPGHGKNFRKLQDEDDGDAADAMSDEEYYAFYGTLGQSGISGDHSVSFNSCVSLTVEEDWASVENFETLSYHIEREQIQSVRNYVLFNVCETMEECSNYDISEQNTYMVDLDTWVTAMIAYLPDQKDLYCEGCVNQQDYCQSVYANGVDQSIDYSSAAFFYDEIKFQLIDCSQCLAYGCYNEDGDAYEQNGWDSVDEWIAGLAYCQETGATWNGLNLNAGFMCNQDGTGLEIGIFMDEACTLYNSKRSYKDVLADGSEDWAYYGKSQSVIQNLFTYMFDCYGSDLIYVNLYQQVYFDENAWAYDPCEIDSSSGEMYDQEACEEIIAENPCYVYTDQDGNVNEVDEENCSAYMEAYPCWIMPGDSVSANYTQACNDYMASYAHEANSACLSLFGDYNANEYQYQYQYYNRDNEQGNNQQNNNGNQEEQEGQFLATSLSGCAYKYENGLYEVEEDQDEQAGNVDGNYSVNFTLTYDIPSNMTNNPTAVCNLLDTMFSNGELLDSQVYDPTYSGQLYEYDAPAESTNDADDSSSSSSSTSAPSSSSSKNVYFPTMNASVRKVVTNSRKMSPGAIVATALGTAAAAFVLLLCISQLVKSCKKKKKKDKHKERLLDTGDQKDLPLVS
jgi:hypothetical protein